MFREECAVMGAWNFPEAARLCYLGLYAMQHRGQESAGLVSLHEGKQISHKGLGLVGEVFNESILEKLKGQASIGHVRYSTTGDNLLANAQPLVASLQNGVVALAHNGNIVNADQLKAQLQSEGAIFQGTNDTEILLHLLSRTPSSDLIACLKSCLPKIVGAYSFVILTHDKLVSIRDPLGMRPLVLGQMQNPQGGLAQFVASETCAFDLIGAELVREIKPGEIFWLDKNGEHSEMFAESKQKAQCIFEHVYFSRPDSVVFGHSVYETRKKFGAQLGKESSVEADLVIPVPDGGIPAALGYSRETGVPFEFGIIRNHYVGRTFIQPHQAVRSFGVKIKLNPQSAILKDKKIVVIDDSLVRGTTSKKVIELLRLAGAKEVHLRIASPPTTDSCFYGVDTPQKSQLIAAGQDVKEICEFIGADTLEYLSHEGMFAALDASASAGPAERKFCAACFDGKYPTPIFFRS